MGKTTVFEAEEGGGNKRGRTVIFKASLLPFWERREGSGRTTKGETGGAKDQVREPDRHHLRSTLFRLQ